MTKHHDRLDAAPATPLQAFKTKRAAQAKSLMVRLDGHRAEPGDMFLRRACHAAEENVADHKAVVFRDKFQKGGALGSDAFDNCGFDGRAVFKGCRNDPANVRMVGRCGRPDAHQTPIFSDSA